MVFFHIHAKGYSTLSASKSTCDGIFYSSSLLLRKINFPYLQANFKPFTTLPVIFIKKAR